MTKHFLFRAVLVAVLVLGFLPQLHAQTDREVKGKQTDLKREYNDASEKNQIIKSAAEDKPRPTTGRSRSSATTGYDYTQVKGYALRQFYDRIDQVFARANDLGLFDEEYRVDGTFPVPGRQGKGSSQMRKVEVYYVEATPDEQELNDIEPYQIIEIYVEKLETLPPEDTGGESEEGGLGLGFDVSASEPIPKGFSLAGTDMSSVLQLVDQNLYEDVLAKRSQSNPIPLPERGEWMPGKVGPFIVMTQRELETTTSRFRDFWNTRDTLQTAVIPPQYEAAGPLYTGSIPVFYDETQKIRVRNPERTQSLKITSATFIGDNADQWEVRTKLPKVLAGKGEVDDKADIDFAYIGGSNYEVLGQLLIDAKEANVQQTVEVVANPGRFPADFLVLDASLDKIELRSPARSGFAPNWKLFYTMGNDEIGLPRWASGISSLGIGYKNQMSVGIVMPMNMIAPDLPTPLSYEKNLFSSPSGYNVNFDFTFGFPFSLGGSLTVINDFDGQDAYSHLRVMDYDFDPLSGEVKDYDNDFFHISTIAQVYYPIMFKDHAVNPTIAFRLNLGGGYVQIMRNHLINNDDDFTGMNAWTKAGREFDREDIGTMVTLEKEDDLFDVYVRMSFINLRSSNRYGMGIQYFAGRMMTDAFLELTSWLRVEAKYSFLLREREIWETETSYFLITPRLRIGLPSIFN
ncbi:MAG: hypothetical protein KFF77_10320 [Bacteroidetes bacterium]|nr:hypothetical protein [Bacteroidota bacterium]